MKILIGAILTVASLQVLAQLPVIESVQPLRTYPNMEILITGRGFSATSSQLQVWFGNTKATTINSSTEFSIEVVVPPQARLDNIEVIHLGSRLSGKATTKFTPVFSGQSVVDPLKFETPVDNVTRFVGDRVFDICTCDFDNDGKPDLAGAKDVAPATDLVVLKNASAVGAASFTKLDKLSLPALNLLATTKHIACGDLNGDGKPELIASRAAPNSVFVLPNTSAGSITFGPFVTLNLENTSDFPREIGIRDLNNDGKPEIIVANSFRNVLFVFENLSAGGVLNINPVPLKFFTGTVGTLSVEVQDFDGDGKPDIIAGRNQTNDFVALRNTSAGAISFAAAETFSLPGSLNDLASADFNRDGKLDLVFTSVFNARAFVVINNSTPGDFSFPSLITLTTGTEPFGAEVNDINGDKHPDIIVSTRTALMNVFVHNGNVASPGFTKVDITTTRNNWYIKVGDFDGDAKPDIATCNFNATNTTFSVDVLRNKNCHVPEILNEGPLKICPGQTIRLKTIPMPAVTFSWSDGVTTTPSGTNPFLDITAAGNYTVTATGESGACAVASVIFPVAAGVGIPPADPVISSNAPLCTGSNLNLTTGTVAGATYVWQGPNSFSSSQEDPTISSVTRTAAGEYSLKITVGDCTSNTVTHQVDIVDLASFSVGSNAAGGIICQGQTATLSINNESGYTYQWIKDGTDIGGQTGTTLAATTEGAYTVRVTRTTAPTCSIVTSPALDLDVYTTPTATMTVDATACLNEVLTFGGAATADGRATVAYSWNFGDAGSSTSQNTTHAYTTAQTFNPILTVSYAGVTGCTDTDTKSINVANAIVPDITSDLAEICPGETANLSITGTFTSVTWSGGETNVNTVQVTNPGDYTVTTRDANDCESTDEITINLTSGCGEVNIIIPKLFSPNGDTNNDTWVITGVESFTECTMSIFDGRGRRVFEKKGYTNPGWDGTYSGKEVPAGTYYYVFSCPSGKPLTGSVLIVR